MPARWFTRTPGTTLAPLADAWVAHSALSNSSHVINEECAALVRLTPVDHPLPEDEICQRLAREFGQAAADIADASVAAWDQLVDVGLLTEHPPAVAP